MSKVVNTYWDNGRTVPALGGARKVRSTIQARSTRKAEKVAPQWFVLTIPVLLSFLIVLTLNVRAWTNVQHEYQTNQQLSTEIEQLTTQNTSLQEEVHRLQNDPKTIEREARKLGMGRMNEKVFVPAQ